MKDKYKQTNESRTRLVVEDLYIPQTKRNSNIDFEMALAVAHANALGLHQIGKGHFTNVPYFINPHSGKLYRPETFINDNAEPEVNGSNLQLIGTRKSLFG